MGTEKLTAVPVHPKYAEYVKLSLYRIFTVYSVIAEPPSEGATQVIVTSVPEIAVTGAAGAAGVFAGGGISAPFPEVDAAEAPKTFMACT
jgi:hypothetical protein